MRKNLSRRLLTALIGVAVIPCALLISARAADSDAFYQDLADLVQQDNDEAYFDSMELTIGSKVLTVDGEAQALDVAPDIKNSRTMLPIRAVAEAAGAEVGYDAASRTVSITSAHGDEIACAVGAESMTVNAAAMELDSAAYIQNGRTYLPVRAVSEALGMDVEWDGASSTVTLTAPYQTARLLVRADSLQTDNLGAEKVLQDGNGLWVLQFASPNDAKNAAETLNGMGVTAEPDYYIPVIEPEAAATSAAAGSHYSWGAVNSGFDAFLSESSSLLSGRSGVVAVVDSGVDASHSYLQGKLLSGKDFVDGDNTPNDQHSHGTHVAGTIVDCVGSASVKILPVRVLNARGAGVVSLVAAGIEYAADRGADVINLSLGGSHSQVVDAAVQYAVSKGSTVVIAAGNEHSNTRYVCPAHLTVPGSIIVSAGDSNQQKADFSNYGAEVDVMAPGVSIRASIPGGGYGYKSGTSMAAPHVSAAAVLLDMAWGKTLTPAQIETQIHTATTYGKYTNQQVGYGFLDLTKAELPDLPASVSIDQVQSRWNSDTTVRVFATCTFSNTTINGYKLYMGTSSSDLSEYARKSTTFSSSPASLGFDLDASGLRPGTYYYQFVVSAGQEYKSPVRSFTVAEKPAEPQPEPTPEPDPEPTPDPTPVERTATGYAVGTDGSLAINDKPAVSPGWSTQLGAIPEGASCTVFLDRVSGSWYWVRCNGVEGYAHKNYITFNTRYGVVHDTDGSLSVNNRPLATYNGGVQRTTIPEGQSCIVFPDKTSGSWYYVVYNGVAGYAHKNYIRLQ